ncbi:MAG TPA: hypothetical protein VHK28_03705 [Candidatus Limnocylindria bacterium]|nr:hypothetical protein [Candidatus Limnocylindria bacterium]
MKYGRGKGLAVVVTVMLLVAHAAPVAAEHAGRDIGSFSTCDRPVNPPRCSSVGNDRWHFVYIDPSVPAALADSIRDAIAKYDATYLIVREQVAINHLTDAVAFAADHGANGAAGWVYCPLDAPQGINHRGHRWCQRQEIHFNLNARYAVFFDDDASRDHLACHELGHTIGLRHWGNPPRTDGPAGATCLNADTPNGPLDLHQADVDHILDYYASPGAWIAGALRDARPRRGDDAATGMQRLGGLLPRFD